MGGRTVIRMLVVVGVIVAAASVAGAENAAPGKPSYRRNIDTGVFEENPESNQSFIKDVLEKPDTFMNERVLLSGAIGAEVATSMRSAIRYFNFNDRFGYGVIVRVNEEEPTGRKLLEVKKGDPVTIVAVVEQEGPRVILARAELRGGSTWDPLVILLLSAAGVVLIVVIVLVVYLMRRSSEAPMALETATTFGPVVASPTTKVIEQTQKVPAAKTTMISSTGQSVVAEPGDSTVKMLPGYFNILNGTGKGKRVYIFAAFTTLGRLRGGEDSRGLSHIGFDPSEKTISREQAELRFDAHGGQFLLKNIADPALKNSSVINGKEMQMNEQAVLHEGDKVQFGTIELEFRTMGAGA